jgi:hypothetical protein
VNITPQGARSLAYWVSVNAPGIYAELVRLAAAQTPRTPRLAGGGCPGCSHRVGLGWLGQDITPLDVTPTVDVTPPLDYFTPSITSMNYVPVNYFGTQDFTIPPPDAMPGAGSMIPEITVTGTPDVAFTTLDPATLAPITVDQSALTVPDVPGYTAPPPSGPSWFSNVASYLITGGGINALLGLGTQVLRTQAAGSQVVAAQILNAQASRVMAGGTPAAISYRRDPVTGQIIPVLASSTGAQYPVTHSMLNTLAPNASTAGVTSFLSQYGLYLAAGLVALVFLARR